VSGAEKRPKALIAMSGGVDSSVAAYLTHEQGYDCIGCTMKLYDNGDAGLTARNSCCSLDDIDDARSVAYRIGFPYYVFHFEREFRSEIIEKFVHSYECGRTPNPCIDCNHRMKFGSLMQRARELGCDKLVTGHYARIEFDGERYLLKKALDPSKDQSYVLYNMTQEQLAHVLFPLGGMTKTQTREIAAAHGFVNAEKHDSQDICFVPDGDYARIIALHSGKEYLPGSFVDSTGRVLGTHKGIIHYTVGQRKGLGLSLPEPMYVCKICPETNTVVLGRQEELLSREADAAEFNWIAGGVPTEPVRCKAKIRYRQPEQWATVTATGSDTVHLIFDEPQRAITPGQAAVLYDGDVVLGGGTIL
jgi:tRNA-specific 2-thiouridylase